MSKKFKIQHERDICIGCGACVAVAPDFWVMNEDGKSEIIEGKTILSNTQEIEMDDLGSNKEAAEVCPVNCIHIYEEGKKKI